MAARSRTLLQLRTAVRGRCMLESETDLISNTLLNEWLNESIQDFRLELSNEDVEAFLAVATGTLTAGVVGGMAHGSLTYPDSAYAVYGLDITVGDRLVNVPPMSFAERNDYQSGSEKTGVPLGFHITNIGAESTTTVGSGTIILSPAPDQAYAYRLWYLPVWVDLADDTHVFNTVGGGDRWVVLDTAIKAATRMNDAKNQASLLLQERDRAMARIVRTIKRMNRAGAVRRRDSRAERL